MVCLARTEARPRQSGSDQVLLISEQGLSNTLHFLVMRMAAIAGQTGAAALSAPAGGADQQLTPISNVEAFWDPTAETPDQQMQRRWPDLATGLG